MFQIGLKRLVKIKFLDARGGLLKSVDAMEGKTLLEVTHANDIDVEGACGGNCACATCHMVLKKNLYDSLCKPTMDEADMLDLSMDVTKTSRLGCQVKVNEMFEGEKIVIPSISLD
jgi:ferredoxin